LNEENVRVYSETETRLAEWLGEKINPRTPYPIPKKDLLRMARECIYQIYKEE
jgi:hypothetical protein